MTTRDLVTDDSERGNFQFLSVDIQLSHLALIPAAIEGRRET